MITELTDILAEEIKLSEDTDELSDDVILSLMNLSAYKIGKFVNEKTDRTDYVYDNTSDANEVLAPTASSNANRFIAYCKIKFAAYSGNEDVISYVDATKVLIYPDDGNYEYDESSGDIVYTVPMLGVTLDRTYQIEPPSPVYVDVDLSGNNILITAPLNHVPFDILVKKDKETSS